MKPEDIRTPDELASVEVAIYIDTKEHFNMLMLALEKKGWVWGDSVRSKPTELTPSWVGKRDGYIHLRKRIYNSYTHEGRTVLDIDWENKTQTPIKVVSGTYCSCPSPKIEKRHSGMEWFNFCVNCRKEKS